MVDLPDLPTVRQIIEAPWYVGLGFVIWLAARAGWNQLEKRWEHERAHELERWRHENQLELELLEQAREGGAEIRATAEAVRALRVTGHADHPQPQSPVEGAGDRDPDPPRRTGGGMRRRRAR